MDAPLCSDGTREHVWVPVEESDRIHIERCAACGQGRITTYHDGGRATRYRRGFQPAPTVKPGNDAGAPSAVFARRDAAIPETRQERTRRQMRETALIGGGAR